MGKPVSLHNPLASVLADNARRLLACCAFLTVTLLRLAVAYWEFPSTLALFSAIILAAEAGWFVDGVWYLPIIFILSGRALYHRFRH